MKEYTFKTAEWVVIPYLDNGNTSAGVDCLGLVSLILTRETGVFMPSLKAENWEEAETYWQNFVPISLGEIRMFDVIVMSEKTTAISHCGVVIGKNIMIHALEGHGVIVSKISTWKSRIRGAYRHKDMK